MPDIKEKLVELLADYYIATGVAPVSPGIADHLIANGVTIQQWISVEERLPEDDPDIKKHVEGENFGFLTVLVYNGVVKQTNRFFCNTPQFGLPKTDGWEWASMNVTHWMPLPEPPKGERL